uniref:hypothetical protein n=1 Tax=Klebsiella pneumoniae TaxID=573 RepID=UPI0013D16746
LLMLIMGYGISLDVENLRFAVLDQDQTGLSQGYAQRLAQAVAPGAGEAEAARRPGSGRCRDFGGRCGLGRAGAGGFLQ